MNRMFSDEAQKNPDFLRYQLPCHPYDLSTCRTNRSTADIRLSVQYLCHSDEILWKMKLDSNLRRDLSSV